MAFSVFEPAGADPREAWADFMADPERDWSECKEMDELCRTLSRHGVEHRHGGFGPFSEIEFRCPHGKVRAVFGPGTKGASRGLLQAECAGWDFSSRGDLTARQVFETYMAGGW